MKISSDQVRQRLSTVMDPELNVDIVSLGLIYDVSVKDVQVEGGKRPSVHILMTLTTPGCPLAPVIEKLVKEALSDLENFDPENDLIIEITFDPPWVPDMMTEEARAEVGV